MSMTTSLQQTVRMRMMLENICDFGIESKTGTTISTDLVIIGDQICPRVMFSHGGCERSFLFEQGYKISWFASAKTPNAREDWQKNAVVLIGQEDPTLDEVVIAVLYRGSMIELVTTTEELALFFDFVFLDYDFTGGFDGSEDSDLQGVNVAA